MGQRGKPEGNEGEPLKRFRGMRRRDALRDRGLAMGEEAGAVEVTGGVGLAGVGADVKREKGGVAQKRRAEHRERPSREASGWRGSGSGG